MKTKTFNDYVIEQHPTGSRYICTPAPFDTDKDTVLLVKKGYENTLEAEGFAYSMGEIEYETCGDFASWRRGDDNYIITENSEFYNIFVKATIIAQRLNLTNKDDRITLFQALLYNVV